MRNRARKGPRPVSILSGNEVDCIHDGLNGDMQHWSHGPVSAQIEARSDGVDIYEWQSSGGHTVEALQELGRLYGNIHVVGVGTSPDSPSWRYWLHMRAKGLVNSMEDDEGREVT